MKEESIESAANKMGILNLIVILLTIYVLVALLVDTILVLSPETSVLLNYIDISICIFFLFEFAIRFYKTKNKLDKTVEVVPPISVEVVPGISVQAVPLKM